MAKTATPPHLFRFGIFELDMRSEELRKRGVRLPIQGRSLHVLAVLLENPGEVVKREELRHRIWPADTFVDFDHSVHNAIARLRETLGDSADTLATLKPFHAGGTGSSGKWNMRLRRRPPLLRCPMKESPLLP